MDIIAYTLIALAVLIYLGVTVTQKVQAFAKAIAKAEGHGIPGAIPTEANNPGDLVLGDKGYGTLGSAGITVFPDIQSGMNALYKELALIIAGQSHVYNLDMTISDMAQHWTTTQQDEWANNVANALGVSTDTTLRRVLT
jgi:hypothetical protein